MDIYQLDYILHEPEESEGWSQFQPPLFLAGEVQDGDDHVGVQDHPHS